MNVLICSDKYKGSISALEVCIAIKKGLQLADPKLDCTVLPLADGGDGTGLVLCQALQLKEHRIKTVDPLGRIIEAKYYYDETTAYIELAEASGMWRLDSNELDVMRTTTIGTGKLINDAISLGFKNVVLCLGGSCTNEMGLGIAYTLGYRFLDARGNTIIPSGCNLIKIQNIVKPNLSPISLRVLCDVNNPLFGPQGAAQVYGMQKGADELQIEKLDEGVKHVSDYIETHFGKKVAGIDGAGAAGGIAAGLYGLMDSVIVENGFEYLSSLLNIPQLIKKSDLVVTGEGRLDRQSLQGKVVGKVALLALKAKVPIIAIVGQSDLSQSDLNKAGILHCSEVVNIAKSQSEAISGAKDFIFQLGVEVGQNLHIILGGHNKE